MSTINLEALRAQFPPTVLEEIEQKQQQLNLELKERFKLHGAATVLRSGNCGEKLSTLKIAEALDSTESTIYRHFPKPLIDTLLTEGVATLRKELLAPRYQAIQTAATVLAIDKAVEFPEAVKKWSEVYGAIANPASVFDIALGFTEHSGEVIAEHADMITTSLSLLALRDGIAIPKSIGLNVFQATAAYDVTPGLDDLGGFTERTVNHAANF